MKKRHALLAAGLCVAAYLAVFADKTPADAVEVAARTVESAAQRPPAQPKPSSGRAASPPTGAPTHIERLVDREALIVRRSGRDDPSTTLFQAHSWATPPLTPASTPAAAPVAPPLPYTYIGKQQQDGQWRIYVSRDGLTHVVQAGDVLEKTYRVEAIKPPVLTLTYLPLDQTQTLTIE